jgi:hypothetical protein
VLGGAALLFPTQFLRVSVGLDSMIVRCREPGADRPERASGALLSVPANLWDIGEQTE